MKIALMQMDIIWENTEKNLLNAERLIAEASMAKCDVAVFPEMFSTGFSMNNSIISEKPDGMVLSKMKKLAIEYNLYLIAGVAVEIDQHYENRAFIINLSGEIIGEYSKNYGFSYSGENQKYKSGDEPILFSLKDISASVFICYDLRFPELFRKIAESVSMIFIIANWPDSRIDHWKTLLKARAIENQCFIIGVNRIGIDGYGLEYSGNSLIFDPMGKEVSSEKIDNECLIAEINPYETEIIRKKFPFLKDMK